MPELSLQQSNKQKKTYFVCVNSDFKRAMFATSTSCDTNLMKNE